MDGGCCSSAVCVSPDSRLDGATAPLVASFDDLDWSGTAPAGRSASIGRGALQDNLATMQARTANPAMPATKLRARLPAPSRPAWRACVTGRPLQGGTRSRRRRTSRSIRPWFPNRTRPAMLQVSTLRRAGATRWSARPFVRTGAPTSRLQGRCRRRHQKRGPMRIEGSSRQARRKWRDRRHRRTGWNARHRTRRTSKVRKLCRRAGWAEPGSRTGWRVGARTQERARLSSCREHIGSRESPQAHPRTADAAHIWTSCSSSPIG